MTLTGITVRAALAAAGAVGKQIKTFDELAAGADGALRQAPAGLTADGAAAFLATAAVESAWFRTTTEYGRGQRYAPFIGRTFVQLTWRENYAGFGRWLHGKGLVTDPDVFVRDPGSLSDFRWAWLGAVYYFEAHGLWKWANAGDFRAVSQAVNGGNGKVGTSFTPNGWRERQAMYGVFRGVGAALLPAGTPAPAPATSSSARPVLRLGDRDPGTGGPIRRVQAFANRNFRYAAPLDEDGAFGDATGRWVAEFQRRVGIPAGGTPTIGPNTWAQLSRFGYR